MKSFRLRESLYFRLTAKFHYHKSPPSAYPTSIPQYANINNSLIVVVARVLDKVEQFFHEVPFVWAVVFSANGERRKRNLVDWVVGCFNQNDSGIFNPF